MQMFVECKPERIILHQPAIAWVGWLGVIMALGMLAMIYPIWRDGGPWTLLLVFLCLAVGAFCVALMARFLTAITLTFDGAARTLTIDRKRPWGARRSTAPFSEFVDVATSTRWRLDHSEFRVDVTLAGERRLSLHYDGGQQAEIEAALTAVRRLCRR
jgi:hypothetical protein